MCICSFFKILNLNVSLLTYTNICKTTMSHAALFDILVLWLLNLLMTLLPYEVGSWRGRDGHVESNFDEEKGLKEKKNIHCRIKTETLSCNFSCNLAQPCQLFYSIFMFSFDLFQDFKLCFWHAVRWCIKIQESFLSRVVIFNCTGSLEVLGHTCFACVCSEIFP